MAKIYANKVVPTASANIAPETYESVMYRGFKSDNVAQNYKLFDFDLVKQDIINHFYIRKGEKLENPEFGSIIWDLLFENFTDDVNAAIAKDVETVINYEQRIRAESVRILSTEQGISIEADLLYIPMDISQHLIMNFDRRTNLITWQ